VRPRTSALASGRTRMTPIPRFLDGLPVARAAWEYADQVHRGQTRKFDGVPFLTHPCEVARILHGLGAPDRLVAAGLLHDTVERTDATPAELRRRFGREVSDLVLAVTEDPGIYSYRRRKAALRHRATSTGEEAAVLFAADKLSKVRQYRAQLAQLTSAGQQPRPRRLHHYRRSLTLLERAIPGHPLVGELEAELEAVDAQLAAALTAA
jgi:hypothetical protein